MRIVLFITNLLALAGAIIWWTTAPDWEPAVTSAGLFGAILAQVFTSEETRSKLKLTQKSDKQSSNYQAGGNQTIEDNKKIQNSGKGSQQLQAENMIVHVGIDERRAREIYQEMNLQLRKDYSQEAIIIATARVSEFENRLMPRMEEVEGALEAFGDPSFQLLLHQAQKTAAATERPADYDLLSELLIHRFQKGENRIARAGISRAVEIVDEMSNEALLGLTVSHAISSLSPLSGNILRGLDVLDELFGSILYNKLPSGKDWIEHLDILDAARPITFGSLKKIKEYYPSQLSGYTDAGIEKNSQHHLEAIELLKTNNLPQSILVNHALNNNFVRLEIPERRQISKLSFSQQIQHYERTENRNTPLNDEQKNALESIYSLYKQDEQTINENVNSFMEEWDKRSNLKIIREWWDNIGISFQITAVGKILAHSNAQRCNKSLPPLD